MPNVYIETLGCARNQVDSEVMAAALGRAGWRLCDEPGDAEAIVVNTCSFIESATDESIDTILALAAYKTRGRCRRLIVSGCLPERYREETAKALPEVDQFLGTGAYDQVVAAVSGTVAQGACLLPDPDRIDIQTPVRRRPFARHAAYLKIAEGCSRHCTFCIIPKLRGRQKSRLPEAVIAEARALTADGVREITLVAQETTAYGRDLAGRTTLAGLMGRLADVGDNVWYRFLYGHPQTMTTELVRTIAQNPKLCPYFDVPIQHASETVLQSMGRRYRADDLKRLFTDIREIAPEAALRTTVLVGFPGERDSDFQQLADLVRQVEFDHLGVFAYSDAEDLASHTLGNHVEPQVARERLDALMQIQREISERRLMRYDEQPLTVLVEKQAEPGIYTARSMFQAPEVDGCVLIKTDQVLEAGLFLPVRIVETLEYDLIAEPV
ncbi:MAG: 30S ribosomal protein S12 methylthiotransferase RimO [Desulfobacteraceae bacterium]|jgi:ribosomal protein S12 methylthiotransferase